MRRLFTLTAALLLAVCCIAAVGADVIFEPDDSFYDNHRDQCEYHSRSYTANGPNGDVTVYESPESDKTIAVLPNGETLPIYYIFADAADIPWGFYENWQTGVSGWVPMEYLELIYDEISFREEFGSQLLEETGALSAEHTGQTVKFWSYPGSTGYLEVSVETDYAPEYQMVYTDVNGARWGRVGYYMAIKGYWVNLDDPTADYDTLYPDAPEETDAPTEPSEEAAQTPVQEIVPQKPEGTSTVVLVAAIAVLGVVGLTAVLLVTLKRKA